MPISARTPRCPKEAMTQTHVAVHQRRFDGPCVGDTRSACPCPATFPRGFRAIPGHGIGHATPPPTSSIAFRFAPHTRPPSRCSRASRMIGWMSVSSGFSPRFSRDSRPWNRSRDTASHLVDRVPDRAAHTSASARAARITDDRMTPLLSGHFAQLDDGQPGSSLVCGHHELEPALRAVARRRRDRREHERAARSAAARADPASPARPQRRAPPGASRSATASPSVGPQRDATGSG